MSLEVVKNGANTVIGVKQTLKAVENGKAKMVLVAKDADPHITNPIKKTCDENAVVFKEVESMVELGKACGIHVGASAVAVLND